MSTLFDSPEVVLLSILFGSGLLRSRRTAGFFIGVVCQFLLTARTDKRLILARRPTETVTGLFGRLVDWLDRTPAIVPVRPVIEVGKISS